MVWNAARRASGGITPVGYARNFRIHVSAASGCASESVPAGSGECAHAHRRRINSPEQADLYTLDCSECRPGAQGRTRTGTVFTTRPSNVRVYQFRHLGKEHYFAFAGAFAGAEAGAAAPL